MLTCILCRINDNHTFRYLVVFLSLAKEPILKIANSRLPILIQLSLKTRPLLREPFDFLPSVAQRRILIDISEAMLRPLLIVVAFCTSRGVHLFASWLQILAEGSGLEHIYTCNRSCSFALLRLHNPIAVFSPSNRSKQLHGR